MQAAHSSIPTSLTRPRWSQKAHLGTMSATLYINWNDVYSVNPECTDGLILTKWTHPAAQHAGQATEPSQLSRNPYSTFHSVLPCSGQGQAWLLLHGLISPGLDHNVSSTVQCAFPCFWLLGISLIFVSFNFFMRDWSPHICTVI